MGEEIKSRRLNDDETMSALSKIDTVDATIIRAAILGVDITEMYSPVRIAGIAAKYGLVAGDSFEFRTVYDLWGARTQARDIKRMIETQPKL